ncbi:MAG: hypothetical protein ABEK03_02075 [Candidatus Bipolaricaulia bacterium]
MGEILLLAAVVIGLLHHVDHVLRFDHSGWPFKADINEFTFSLLVYPVVALTLWARRGSLARVGLATIVFLAPTLAHIFIETPAHQHDTWANHPEINLLGVSSPILGNLAGTITVLLSLVGFGAVIALAHEWRVKRG